MIRRSTLVAFVLVFASVATAVLLLVTGGENVGSEDPSGDVIVSEGGSRPSERSLALVDIRHATIEREGDDLVFEVRMSQSVPNRAPKQALVWRWEIYEDGEVTWLVSANIDLGPNVSVSSTQGDYQASTVDEGLPGQIQLDDSKLIVRLRSAEIPGFPPSFEWLVKTSLDADRAAPTSALAEDQAPDGGYLRVTE